MISIVIPVYNVRPYLDECLGSVLSQSCTHFECILVDDGSTDGSGELCDAWAAKDVRFRVIHQPNSGVSAARNRGMEQAQGEYICFIDSDDWIESNYLATLERQAESSKADLIVCGLTHEFKNGKKTEYKPAQTRTFHLDKNNSTLFVRLNEQNLFYGPYTKLYKTIIIRQHHIMFNPKISYGEDLLFNYQYLEYVEMLACIDRSLYHYRILEGGTLSSKFRADMFYTDYTQWKVLRSFYEMHELFSSEAQIYLFKRLWGIIYEGIFLYPKLRQKNLSYLQNILSIPEIAELKTFSICYPCSKWIKKVILRRAALVFYIYFSFHKNL